MYVHPKLARKLALLDAQETNLRLYGVNRFQREKALQLDTKTAIETQKMVESEGFDSCESVPTTFRHSGWERDRTNVVRAMLVADCSLSMCHRFRECGTSAWVVEDREKPGNYGVAGNYCKSRWCVPCSVARGRVVSNAIFERIESKVVRFITLTVRSDKAPLKDALNKLYDAFRRLQRTNLWRKCVDGGVAIVEVKRNFAKESWHPHLHCIVEGRFIPQKVLSEVWHSLTKDSFIVDVRLVKNAGVAARYVTKYVSKPLQKEIYRHIPSLVEAIQAMHGRRALITFGDWRGMRLVPKKEPGEYRILCRLETLISHCLNGEASALAIYARLRRLPHVLNDGAMQSVNSS